MSSFGCSSPEKSPRLLEQEKIGEQMPKGGATEEEEGAGEVLCLVTDLAFKTSCLILTSPGTCPFLCIAV